MELDGWILQFHRERERNGISRKAVAAAAGVSRECLCRVESGKMPLTDQMQQRLAAALKALYPEPLNLMIDYVRIRFSTMDIDYILERVLRLKMKYFVQEDHGFYSYSSMYVLGDITVMTSPDEEKGVLLELKGKGCRQFEAYLNGQKRSWYEFFRQCLEEDAVFKRIDLAINDRAGILDIPFLCNKCDRGECISVFRSFKAYRSGELVRSREENKASMGATLYIGSMQSDLYFCIYEKDYEQLVKQGVPIEDAEIKNRFEIRLKSDRAYEPCMYGWDARASHRWYGGDGQGTVFFCDKPQESAEHPTMKPVELFARQIRNSTRKGKIVFDPFCGSGTSVLAAETYGRKCRAIELSPHNCDVILARWEQMTGHAAVLLEGGAADARAETTD